MKKNGTENLIPLNRRTKKEVKEITSKGGKANGRKRQEERTYKELAKTILKTNVDDEELLALAKQFGIEKPNIKTLTLLGLIRSATNGSYNAFDRLMELTGEKEQNTNADIMAKLDSVIGKVDELAK